VKKLLFGLIAVAMVVAMIGSAFAYFTDVETSTGNVFQAGTLDIQIQDSNEGPTNSVVSASFVSPANLLPGNVFETNPVYLKNVGTADILRYWARFGTITENDNGYTDAEGPGSVNNIQDYIKLVSYSENKNDGTWVEQMFTETQANAYLDYWNSRSLSGTPFVLDGVVSLGDLATAHNYGSGDRVTTLCLMDGSGAPAPMVTNDTFGIKFKFQLLPATDNRYQSDTATFSVNFIGSQLTDYPDDTLWESITERPLVP